MVPAPMRPVQNWLVILAAFLVAGSLLPWNPRYRAACAGGAIAIVLLLLVTRLRAHSGNRPSAAQTATQARIDRIRADRAARMNRRR
jgi:hypothetical protein